MCLKSHCHYHDEQGCVNLTWVKKVLKNMITRQMLLSVEKGELVYHLTFL